MAVRTVWAVTHSCGHSVDFDLSRRPADRRAGFARWLQERACTDCWKAGNSARRDEWLATRRAAEQAAATEWAKRFDMPPLDGPERALEWGARCRHQLVAGAYATLVVEGTWDESDWAVTEEKVRVITRAGWWIDQREAEARDLPELLDAAEDDDRGTENPFR